MELTSRQREIFDFCRAFIKERGYPPSIREIGEHFKIYPRAVFDHLKALEKKGYLKRRSSMSRGLEVLVFQEGGPGHGLYGKVERTRAGCLARRSLFSEELQPGSLFWPWNMWKGPFLFP